MAKNKNNGRLKTRPPLPQQSYSAPLDSSRQPEVQVNFQQNNLHLDSEKLSEIQIAAAMPADIRDRAMDMAEKEQAARHEYIKKQQENDHALKVKELAFKSKQLQWTSVSDLVGKIAMFIVVVAYFFLMGSLIWYGKYTELAITGVLGAGALLGLAKLGRYLTKGLGQ